MTFIDRFPAFLASRPGALIGSTGRRSCTRKYSTEGEGTYYGRYDVWKIIQDSPIERQNGRTAKRQNGRTAKLELPFCCRICSQVGKRGSV